MEKKPFVTLEKIQEIVKTYPTPCQKTSEGIFME